jgi:Fe-S cluster assembly iron-binding protein IscA
LAASDLALYNHHLISDEKGKFDELVEEKGVKVLIDPKALMHVIGTKMDYVDDPLKYCISYRLFCLPCPVPICFSY